MKLLVHSNGDLVGEAVGVGDQFGFTYAPGWTAFPISVRLPIRADPYSPEEAHPYFANLLPEGGARDALAQRLGVSRDNDVALLVALGDDTAGALRLLGERVRSVRERQPITQDDLATWARGTPAFFDDPDRPPRLSLAGAQHKTSAVRTSDGFALAASGEPSTHILKFDSPRFPHLSANELITTRFAANLGLETVASELDETTDPPFLIVQRYDRSIGEHVVRHHQEDFCQVFGLPPTRKYEPEGGPSLQQIATALRRHSTRPALDIRALIQWVIFNAIAGNADGHAKNLSIVRDDRGLRLAPFYDLVCTRAYPRLDRSLAMSVGGQRDPDRLTRANWQIFSDDLNVKSSVVFSELSRMLAAAPAALNEACSAAPQSPAVQHVRKVVSKRLRGVGGNL